MTRKKGLAEIIRCFLALISKVTSKKSLNIKVNLNIALIYYLLYFVSKLRKINALTEITFKAMFTSKKKLL